MTIIQWPKASKFYYNSFARFVLHSTLYILHSIALSSNQTAQFTYKQNPTKVHSYFTSYTNGESSVTARLPTKVYLLISKQQVPLQKSHYQCYKLKLTECIGVTHKKHGFLSIICMLPHTRHTLPNLSSMSGFPDFLFKANQPTLTRRTTGIHHSHFRETNDTSWLPNSALSAA